MFEPGLAWHYAIVGFVTALLPALIIAGGFSVDPKMLTVFPQFGLILGGGLLARRIQLNRIATALEVVALFYLQSIVALIFIVIMASISGPYADAMLDGWDRAIGFDWMAYFDFCRPLSKPLIFAYVSYYWQPLVVISALILTGRQKRLFTWMTLAFASVLVCAVTFALLPAQAPYAFYGVTPADYPERPDGIQWTFLHTLNYFKNGGDVLGPKVLTGMLTFPSYHATAAVLFTWAVWPIRLLRWPMLALNIAMLTATPIVGNHYLVDVLAGVMVGLVAVLVADRLRSESQLRGGDPRP